MRLLVLTSIGVAAATWAAQTQVDSLCQLGDRSPDAVASGAAGQDSDRRPSGVISGAAAPVSPITLPMQAAAAGAVAPIPLKPAPAPHAVIAFAPKTSPPRARWF